MRLFRRSSVSYIIEPLARMVEDLRTLADGLGRENECIDKQVSELRNQRMNNTKEQIRALDVAVKVEELIK